MKFFKSLALTLGLVAPVVVNAYVLDPTTNVITDEASGKQWLQWTETTGMSVLDDFSSFSGGGWSVASNSDMASLYNVFSRRSHGLQMRTAISTTDFTRHTVTVQIKPLLSGRYSAGLNTMIRFTCRPDTMVGITRIYTQR